MSFYQLDFYSDILQREADVLIAAPAKQEDDCQAEYDYTYLEPEQGQHDDAFWSKWMPEFLRFFTQA